MRCRWVMRRVGVGVGVGAVRVRVRVRLRLRVRVTSGLLTFGSDRVVVGEEDDGGTNLGGDATYKVDHLSDQKRGIRERG